MRRYYEFDRHGTRFRQEALAGITTFLTMAHIIIVNPAILEAAGIPRGGPPWWPRSSRPPSEPS